MRFYSDGQFEIEFGGIDYTVDFEATAKVESEKVYSKLGSACAEENEYFEVEDIKINRLTCFDEDRNEVEVTDKKTLEDADYEICQWLYKNPEVFAE